MTDNVFVEGVSTLNFWTVLHLYTQTIQYVVKKYAISNTPTVILGISYMPMYFKVLLLCDHSGLK